MPHVDDINGDDIARLCKRTQSAFKKGKVQVNDYLETNLPGVYVAGLTKQAFHTRFSSLNVQSDRAFQVVNYVDGVAYKTDEQINLGILSGTIAKWQSTLHTNFEAYLAQEIEEDSEFLNRPLTEIKEALDTRAKADQAAINPQPTGEDIINNIINGNATTT